ncbi:MAG: hypothetical protein ABI641_14135 [Caldimonas sp.]
MHDEHDSPSLWPLSDFQRARDAGRLHLAGDGRPTLLPTTLLADLQQLQGEHMQGDVLEVVAACMRNHEAALLYLEYGSYVWPVTLFPREHLYHSTRDVASLAADPAMSKLRLIGIEPPGVKPPGHAMHERVAGAESYRPLNLLLWTLALQGPRADVLNEISGRVAYRLVSTSARDLPPAPGALASAVARLRNEAASLRDVAGWPGLSVERASRLLNALYLAGALMVSRSHPAARSGPPSWRQWFGRRP